MRNRPTFATSFAAFSEARPDLTQLAGKLLMRMDNSSYVSTPSRPYARSKDRALTSKDGHLDVDDAARALGAHPSRVLAALTSGAGPAERVGRGRFGVAGADLDRLAVALGLGPRAASPDADMAEPV